MWSDPLGPKSVPRIARPASPPEDREAGWGSANDPEPGGPPDPIPIPARPQAGFQGASLNLCFVIWKAELMIPALQDYFAGLYRVPLTLVCKRRSEIQVSAEPPPLDSTWQLAKLPYTRFWISQHQFLCSFYLSRPLFFGKRCSGPPCYYYSFIQQITTGHLYVPGALPDARVNQSLTSWCTWSRRGRSNKQGNVKRTRQLKLQKRVTNTLK